MFHQNKTMNSSHPYGLPSMLGITPRSKDATERRTFPKISKSISIFRSFDSKSKSMAVSSDRVYPIKYSSLYNKLMDHELSCNKNYNMFESHQIQPKVETFESIGTIIKKCDDPTNYDETKYRLSKFDKENFWKNIDKYIVEHKNVHAYDNTDDIPADMLVPLICSRESHLRELKDLHSVAQWLLTVKLVGNLPFRLLLKIAERLETKVYLPKKNLCLENTPGNCAFLIYDGEVGVIIGNQPTNAVFKGGELCGNTSLDNNVFRSATLQAIKKSVVLILAKSDYQSIMGSYFHEKQKSVAHFIKHQIYCIRMNDSQVDFFSRNLFWNFVKVKKRDGNQFLFKKGDKALNVYILRKGKAKELHWFQVACNNTWPEPSGWVRKTITKEYEVVGNLDVGDISGLDDVLNDNETYSYSLEVVENSKLLSVSREFLKRNFIEVGGFKDVKIFEAYIQKRKEFLEKLKRDVELELKKEKKMKGIMKTTFSQIAMKKSSYNSAESNGVQPKAFNPLYFSSYSPSSATRSIFGHKLISNEKIFSRKEEKVKKKKRFG